MEKDLTQNITEYWLRLPIKYKDKLAQIRVWQSLRVAVDNDDIWIRGIAPAQLHSPEIRSIPFKKIYFQRENALFFLEGNLPEERLKTSWVWSPIHTFLPVTLPDYNFNFFGIKEKIIFRIVPSTVEREAAAQWVDMDVLKNSILKTPAVRLQPVQWTIVNKKALLIGIPLLALPGTTLWKHQNFLLPAGFDFEYPELSTYFQKKMTQSDNELIIINNNSTYFTISTTDFQSLSISSFRLSQ
ncbi:hypothetical protein [Kordia zhangzhouensis]|uniref:hypothetical protein n=1 Tax=Kordia zhangzhouensis TaxID=1620405 RepID=UPI000629B8B7|nr:hypothetical protein [Kordia zhangzhouensis]